MSSRSFASVGWVATVAAAALGCYLVSLRVAAERASLESVEAEIVLAQRDIRLLQTEIGTRGRLAQLERWNVKVLALSAPKAEQFLDGGFALAKLTRPQPEIAIGAPVVLAAAPAPVSRPTPSGGEDEEASPGSSAARLLHSASLRRGISAPASMPARGVDRPTPGGGSARRFSAVKASPRTEQRPQAVRDQVATSSGGSAGAPPEADPLAPISSDAPKDSSTKQ